MDRLIESLSHVVIQNNSFGSTNCLNTRNENGGRENTHSSEPGCRIGIKSKYNQIIDLRDGNLVQSSAYNSDTSNIYSQQVGNRYMKDDIELTNSGNKLSSSFEASERLKEALGSSILKNFIIESCGSNNINILPPNLPKESVLDSFEQSTQIDEKKTASDIAMKYSPEDIILSKVRGIFMNRYSRDTIPQEQIDSLKTCTKKKTKQMDQWKD